MKQLKIGILGTRGIPNNYGGFEQFAQSLAQGLVNKGHIVFVYSIHHHPWQQKEWNGVHIIHCKDWEQQLGTAGQFIYDKNCINDACKRNYDVLLHLGYTSDSVWHKKWPSDTLNIVNMDGLEWKRSKYNWLTRLYLKWAESLAAKNADILIADSIAIQQHLEEKYNKPSFYIPYGATIFNIPDEKQLNNYKLIQYQYYLLIARMEPENNIEIVIKGYLLSNQTYPFLIIGNVSGKYGKYITSKYADSKIIYAGALYDTAMLNNLRHYSLLYMHGHSVGGTNPSLLEAMACGCSIAAHQNVFNKAVLGDDADYFFTANDVATLMNTKPGSQANSIRQQNNLAKIKTIYNPDLIINEYEKLMLDALNK